jgi:hypothetical protein
MKWSLRKRKSNLLLNFEDIARIKILQVTSDTYSTSQSCSNSSASSKLLHAAQTLSHLLLQTLRPPLLQTPVVQQKLGKLSVAHNTTNHLTPSNLIQRTRPPQNNLLKSVPCPSSRSIIGEFSSLSCMIICRIHRTNLRSIGSGKLKKCFYGPRGIGIISRKKKNNIPIDKTERAEK